MYRPVRRPRTRLLGDVPRQQRSVWPLVIAGSVLFGMGLGFIGYLSHRTAQMRESSRRARRWG